MRKNDIEKRMADITELLTGEQEVNIDELETEVRTLKDELKDIESRSKREAIAKEIEDGKKEARQVEKPKEEVIVNEKELRGKELLEKRSVSVGVSSVLLPDHQATDIKSTFNEVSSLIDRVGVKNLKGGESFQQPYLVGYGTGDHTAEGLDYATAEPTFAYATINKTKVTAYAEDTEEVVKLPAANYHAEVMKGISVATRKKITKEILIGDGTAGRFVGIFSTAATAIDAATDKSFTAVDENTLDEIIYSYGGEEDVEDTAVLILNKKDLKAFATLRNADKEKVYDVKSNGNTGTIDGVPYIINSACKALGTAAAGEFAMAYGPLSNYTMAIFSDLDVQQSTDYKFKQGMIAHRGSVFAGGNVTCKNGFLRVKKLVVV